MSRRRLFGSLCLLIFAANFARVVFAPLLSEFIRVFGVGPSTVGLIATLAWLGSAAPRLPAGWLLTRVPRHRVILLSGGLVSVAAGFTATANGVVAVGVGALCMGASSGVYFIAANPFVSELFPERVGRMLGIHGMSSQLAAVAAAPTVTLVLLVGSWRGVFVVIGGIGLLATALVYRTARRTDLPEAGDDDRDFLGAARSEWRRILLGVAILGSLGFVWQGLFNFYELYMLAKGLPTATAKNFLTLLFGAGVPAFLVSGWLADRLPHVPYLIGLLLAFVVTVLALTAASSFPGLFALTVVLGFVAHSVFPAMDTFLLDTFPDETRASAYAVYSGSMMVVQATGSSAVGYLVDAGFDLTLGGVALAGFEAVFVVFALGLGGLALGLSALSLAGRLPT